MKTTIMKVAVTVGLGLAASSASAQAPQLITELGSLLPGETQATLSAVPALVLDLADPAILGELLGGSGIPLLPGFVPILGVLTQEPESLPTFLLEGGSLLSPNITALPPIPLVSAPLPGL